jgi:mRNA interferase MazF
MKRGEIWTVSGGGDYTGKPRPCAIVQDNAFDVTRSITICAFTTDPTEAPLFRVQIEPDDHNGLSSPSSLMVDKITTVPKEKLGKRIGELTDEDVLRLNQAMIVFLGLARSARTSK